MKLGIFTTTTRPEERGDNYKDALECYEELADELTVINGDKTWPQEFRWDLIGQHFQKGYEQTNADWVIHADLDFIFHQRDFLAIRQAFKNHNDAPALSFWKHQFILPDRYNLKSRLVIAVNKGKYGDRIRFDSGGDLCQPSLDGQELKPSDVPEAKIPFYNYEKITKTDVQIQDDVGRMARAWQRYHGEYKLGGPDDNTAFIEWTKMIMGRFNKPHQHIKLADHPKYVQETINNLRPDQWGYDGFGLLEKNDYVKERIC